MAEFNEKDPQLERLKGVNDDKRKILKLNICIISYGGTGVQLDCEVCG